MLKSLLSVGEVAQRSGVAVSALHFYERKGLIQSLRTGGNQRRYERSVLRRVAVIQAAQSVGLSLEDIGLAMAGLPRDSAPTAEDWERMSQAWRQALDARIDRLIRLRDGLESCIGCGCLSTQTCPLRNPGDRHGRSGGTGSEVLGGPD
ncbi:MAG: redox-sensitive transcriptional activator SoxR [Devosia sp.]|nr:MAG: redox-sensitive transcriptional activator SoxR [Devosia sp.]